MIPLRHYLIVSFLLLVNAASWGSGVNVTPTKSCSPGGCGGEDEPGYCDSALNASLEWSVNLGWARYVKPPDLVPLSKVPNLKNGNLDLLPKIIAETLTKDWYDCLNHSTLANRSPSPAP